MSEQRGGSMLKLERMRTAFDRAFRNEQNENLQKIEDANNALESKIVQTNNNLQSQIDSLLDGEFEEVALNTHIEQKLNNLESEYAPKLTEVSEQLADIAINPTFEANEKTESANLGVELINNTNWVVPNGWSGTYSTGFKNTVGNTNPLTFTMQSTGTRLFEVAFRVESPSPADIPNASTDFTLTLGNSAPFVTYQGGGNFDYTFGIRSVNDGDLVFIPGVKFDGTIKNVSVKEIIGEVEPSLKVLNGDQDVFEIRSTLPELQNVFIGKKSGSKNTTGRGNVGYGDNALPVNTTGYWNSAFGLEALRDNTTGSRNIALGYVSLRDNISGDRNIAIGTFALHRNTHGRENIALGADTLWYNTTGNYNVGLGHYALGGNTTGDGNVAIGRVALNKNITGNYNVAIGNAALERSTTTQENVAIGRDTLKNTNANQLIAIGSGSQLSNTNAASNVAVGTSTLRTNTIGAENTAIGHFAGYGTSGEIRRNVMVGNRSGYALTTGANDNVLLGNKSGDTITTGNGNIMIGSNTQPTASNSSNQLNIGNFLYGVLPLKRFGIGLSAPTARLHILASDGTTGTAPLKLQAGTLLESKEVGAIEFDGTDLYYTNSSGVRKKITATSV